MSIQTIRATLQMRRGREEDFDPDQMVAGEWAVSTDMQYVYMCFRPGLVRRMATYEAFEKDMLEVQKILKECQDIQKAVDTMENLAEKHSKQSQSYSEQAKAYKEAAENAIDLSKPSFTVDLGTGHLLYSGGRFDFAVENGHLLWGMTL